jgi:hypothetical protein
LQPKANAGVTTSGANISYTGVPKYAKFLVKNVNKLFGGVGLVDGDITLTNNSDHTLSAGNAWFDTSSAGTPNAVCGTSYTDVELVQGTTNYFVSIGGVIQMNKDASGGFNVAGLTVTVNNH